MLPYGIEPYGHTPYGVPYSGTDLSLPDPLVSLDESQYLTYLHYALPYDPNTGARVPIKLSTDGYASRRNDTLPDSTPASFWYFRPWIINAYNGQNDVMDGNGNIIPPSGGVSRPGQAIQSYITSGVLRVDVVIQAITLESRALLHYEWDQAPYVILAGYPGDALANFSVVFSGVSAAINSYDTSQINITLLDYSYLLQKPLQSQVYMGMYGSVRGDGSTTYGDCIFNAPTGNCTIETYVRPKTNASTLRHIAGWKNGLSAGGLYIYFASGTVNRVQVTAIDDTGILYSVHYDGLLAGYRYGIHCTRSVTNKQLYLYVTLNGQIVGTSSITISAAFMTSLSSLVVMKAPDAASGYLSGDIDELRVWNAARSQIDILSTCASEIALPPTNLIGYWKFNEGAGTAAFETISGGGTAKDITLHGTVLWTGTCEGGSDIAGQGAPVWKGVNRQVEPVPVDSQSAVYEVSRNTVAMTVTNVQDKGNPSSYIIDTLLAGQDIYDWTPVNGHCVISYTGGRTLLRVNLPPTGMLTVTVSGPVVDTAGIVQELGHIDGGLGLTYFDGTAFAVYSGLYSATTGIGIRLDTSTTIWSLMQTLAYKAHGWVTVNRFGKITIYKLVEPIAAKYTLSERDIQSASMSIVSRTLAAGKLVYGYRPYNAVQAIGNLATSLSPSDKSDLTQQYRYLSPIVNNTVLSIRPAALPLTIQSAYDNVTDAAIEQVSSNALWGVNRVVILVPLTRGLFRYDIGDTVQITVLCMDGGYVLNMFGIIAVVVGYTIDHKLNVISIRVWCKEPQAYLVTDVGETITDDSGRGILV